jgi:predicted secreted protein
MKDVSEARRRLYQAKLFGGLVDDRQNNLFPPSSLYLPRRKNMKKLLPLVGLVLAVCLVAGCSSVVAQAYTDPEVTIETGANDEFVVLIALDSNPSTGYSWEEGYDETRLELIEETFEPGEYAKQGLVGAGGTELFRFKALKSGGAEIKMEYKRPWETEVLEQKVFTVDVE